MSLLEDVPRERYKRQPPRARRSAAKYPGYLHLSMTIEMRQRIRDLADPWDLPSSYLARALIDIATASSELTEAAIRLAIQRLQIDDEMKP
jgi:hypothetical protein